MKDYSIEIINQRIAKGLIIKNHYSHKWTSCRYAFGLILNNKIVGVCVYGYPVGRLTAQSISKIVEPGSILELTRLWVNDSEGKNTESFFIGQSFKWLRRFDKSIRVLISYSDPMQNHVGYIYQATNWLYQGNKTRLVDGYYHIVNGETLHPRTCFSKYGTNKPNELLKIDPNYERFELERKHRYIYILDKKNKKEILNTLKHPILSYPKSEGNRNVKS